MRYARTAAESARRAHRQHVMGNCFACGRNLWCQTENELDYAAVRSAADLRRRVGVGAS